jgi:transcriptional regulator with XRE-family HTH domain
MRLRHTLTAKLIKDARKKAKLSQTDFHYYAGWSTKHTMQLSNIENNLAPVPPKAVARMAEVLKIPKEVLIESMVQDYRVCLLDEVELWEERVKRGVV